MKTIISASILSFIMFFTNTSGDITFNQEKYSSIETNNDLAYNETRYNPEYESEYWNLLKNKYSRIFYEGMVETDFSNSDTNLIYVYSDDEMANYSNIDIVKGIQYARFDHPELELLDFKPVEKEKTRFGKIISHSTSFHCGNYQEYKNLLEKINLEIDDLVKKVNNTENPVEKHRLIFNWIIQNVEYSKNDLDIGYVDFENEEYLLGRYETNSTQNIYGAIIEKKAICDGIADAYKYICNRCKLECITVHGYIGDRNNEIYHAWNIVKIDNEWYLIDATWNLEYDYFKYFLVSNLYKNNRKPFKVGGEIPGYAFDKNKKNEDLIFIDSNNENLIQTTKGMKFELEDENFKLRIGNTNSSICVDLKSQNLLQDLSSSIIKVKTNAKITKTIYYDYYGCVAKIDHKSKYEVEFKYGVNYTDLYLEYRGNEYKLRLYSSLE